MKTIDSFAAAVFLLTVCNGLVASGETFTAPLNLSIQTGDGGQYLSADFNFHTQFSEIDSVTLQLTMPEGYEGVLEAGGYFSVHRSLMMAVHELNSAPRFGFITFGGPPPASPSLIAQALDISAASTEQIGLQPMFIDTDPPSPYWPDFLFSGQGSVGITDDEMYTQTGGPLGQGAVSSTITWHLPGEISDATLILVGTAVPEPSTAVLLLLGCVGMARQRRKQQKTPN